MSGQSVHVQPILVQPLLVPLVSQPSLNAASDAVSDALSGVVPSLAPFLFCLSCLGAFGQLSCLLGTEKTLDLTM